MMSQRQISRYLFCRKIARENPRWNERVLREISVQEKSDEYKTRAGRLDKWRQLTREACAEVPMPIPEKIEYLDPSDSTFITFPSTVLS